jgi:single-strand DNA-binding protein
VSSLNRAMLIGRLGADPELSFTPAQLSVCKMRIATSERRKNQAGKWEESTEWHSVTVFGKQADYCSEYLQKGALVYVEGRLLTREWETREGDKRHNTEIVASGVRFLSTKQEGAPRGEQSNSVRRT